MQHQSQAKGKLYTVIQRLFILPADKDSAEGRSIFRYRRISSSVLTWSVATGVRFLVSIFTVPILLNYLGAEKYGVYITISSWITFLGFLDFGLGKSLLNKVAAADGLSDRELARRNISSGILLLLAAALILGLIFIFIAPYISWENVISNVSADLLEQTQPAIILLILLFLVNLPLGLVQSIQVGHQEGYISSLWWLLGTILGFVGIILVTVLGGGIYGVVLVTFGSVVLANVLNWIEFFGIRHREFSPRISLFDKQLSVQLVRYGVLFFILQITSAIGFQTDNLIIAKFLGPDQVTYYSIPAKLFSIIPIVLGVLLNPFWAAYGEALAHHDYSWIKKAFARSLYISFFASLSISILLVVFGQLIISYWVGEDISVSIVLIFALGVWNIVMSLGGPLSVLLNSHNIIGFQIVTSTLMGITNLIVSIVLVNKVGVVGVVIGSILSVLIFNIMPSAIYIRKIFRGYGYEFSPEGS